MKRLRKSDGFTLPELMIAGAITSFLMLVTWELILQGADIEAESQARGRMNDQARQAFVMLDTGGVDTATDVRGIRTNENLPSGALADDGRLRVSDGGGVVLSDLGPESSVTCLAPLIPHPDCLLLGQTITVRGWFPATPEINSVLRSVNDRTVEVGVSITDPWLKRREQRRPDSEIETYRTIVTRMNEGAN